MYLLLCKSLTYAQRSARVLEQKGVGATVVKAPAAAQANGCAYCVRIAEKNRANAMHILEASGLPPQRVFRMEHDTLTEVTE